jgi:hypothetical protein
MSDRELANDEQDEQDDEQPDEDEILQEREERLDPDNRPDNVEVDNTDRTFDPETGYFEDRDEHDSAPKQFVDEEEISQESDANEAEDEQETSED